MSWAGAVWRHWWASANIYMVNTMKWKSAKETQTENTVADVSLKLCTATVEGPEATNLTTDMLSTAKQLQSMSWQNWVSLYSDRRLLCVTMRKLLSKLSTAVEEKKYLEQNFNYYEFFHISFSSVHKRHSFPFQLHSQLVVGHADVACASLMTSSAVIILLYAVKINRNLRHNNLSRTS